MKHLIMCLLSAIALSASAQQKSSLTTEARLTKITGLKDIYRLRVKGDDFLSAKKFDSASVCLSAVIKDTIHANATDYMNLSCSRLQLKDTSRFKQYLVYSIEAGGADTTIMRSYFRSLNSDDHAFFKAFLSTVFPTSRAVFLKKVDPQIEQEMNDILYLDQICRRQEDMSYIQQLHNRGDTTNANFKHIAVIGRYIDSVTYSRVVDLIKRNKFPGFHNFGINSSRYDVLLMHVADHGDEQWNFIFNFLKQQLVRGDMMQNQVVGITTRHYRRGNCTYYGSQKMGLSTPCDCEHVDEFREEIGLDRLKEEYQRLNQQLPACYHE